MYEDFPLLRNFTCAVANDEFDKNYDMRTIAFVEHENNFPQSFSREVLKCLPTDVSKIIFNPHTHQYLNNSIILPKQSMIIFVTDNLGEKVR